MAPKYNHCAFSQTYAVQTEAQTDTELGCWQTVFFLFASARFANAADDAWRCHKQQGRGHQCYDT